MVLESLPAPDTCLHHPHPDLHLLTPPSPFFTVGAGGTNILISQLHFHLGMAKHTFLANKLLMGFFKGGEGWSKKGAA